MPTYVSGFINLIFYILVLYCLWLAALVLSMSVNGTWVLTFCPHHVDISVYTFDVFH